MKFVSYAQNFEDVMLWRALKHVGKGFYIDVGAAEPEDLSVTHAFASRGWNGINIEPVESAWRRLNEARPGDINIRAALGREGGEATFFLIGDRSGWSTTSETLAERYRADGLEVSPVAVPVITLAEICRAHVTGPIHFLKIDVEGAERAVLEGADFNDYRPWILVVEATAPNSQIPSHMDWEDLVLNAGYHFVYFDGLNRFYLANERDDLSAAFSSPPNYFDGFVVASEIRAQKRAEEAERQAREAAKRAREAEAWVESMYASKSWRITAPLRMLQDRSGKPAASGGRSPVQHLGTEGARAPEHVVAGPQRPGSVARPTLSERLPRIIKLALPLIIENARGPAVNMRRQAVSLTMRMGQPAWRVIEPSLSARFVPRDAWNQYVPAFLNAVSSVGAFGHELASLRREVESSRKQFEFLGQRMRVGAGSSLQHNGRVDHGRAGDAVILSNKLESTARETLRVNLGCGHVPLDGYVNVDLQEFRGVDILAMVDSLPFEDGSVQELFSAHLLEYIPHEVLRDYLLPYWRGLLARRGLFRAVVAATAFTPGKLSQLMAETGFDDIRVTSGRQGSRNSFELELSAVRT